MDEGLCSKPFIFTLIHAVHPGSHRVAQGRIHQVELGEVTSETDILLNLTVLPNHQDSAVRMYLTLVKYRFTALSASFPSEWIIWSGFDRSTSI